MDLVIYGAGGFGKEIACLIHNQMPDSFKADYSLIGFIDDGMEVGVGVKYGNVLGGVDYINNYKGNLAVVFSIAQPEILQKAQNKITNNKVKYPNLIAPGVVFYDSISVKMGHGNVLMHGCRLSCDVSLGNFNLFNGFVAVGHDVYMNDFNVFGPSARISGDVNIGNANFFGLNSAVLQGLEIGSGVRLGAGSVLMKNALSANSLYFGNPARKMTS
jgi:sugar O-acyltransferase (sialic acid O-acetyltransferase NeuD family)